MENVLITGGLGFIGHHLVKNLLEQKKIKITVIDIKPIDEVKKLFDFSNATLISNLENEKTFLFNNNQVSFVQLDIRNPDDVMKLFEKRNFDSCVHLAAKVSVIESIANPEETFSTNEFGTFTILEACALNNVNTVVFASSAAVYGEPKELPIKEDHVLEPLSPYGSSKISGEALLSSYVHSGKISSGVSLRFFNVYGEGQNPEYAGVITKFAERLTKDLPPIIYGDGLQTRDFIYVGDIVQAINLSLNNSTINIGYHFFNVATGTSVSVNDLASVMMKIFGKNLDPIHEKERLGEIRDGSANISRIVQTLHFKPNVELENGLSEFKKNFAEKELLKTN